MIQCQNELCGPGDPKAGCASVSVFLICAPLILRQEIQENSSLENTGKKWVLGIFWVWWWLLTLTADILKLYAQDLPSTLAIHADSWCILQHFLHAWILGGKDMWICNSAQLVLKQTKLQKSVICRSNFENLLFARHYTIICLCTLSDSILPIVTGERDFYCPHYTDEEREAWRR